MQSVKHIAVLALLPGLVLMAGCEDSSSPTAAGPLEVCEPSNQDLTGLAQSTADGAMPRPGFSIDADIKAALTPIRNSLFGGSMINAALQQTTISGDESPVFALTMQDRALLVWRIRDGEIAAFAAEIGLPAPLSLAPVSLPAAVPTAAPPSEPGYYLVADLANTSRAEQGASIEWKTYVMEEPDTTPRLYRFSKASAVAGLDLLEPRQAAAAADLAITRSKSGFYALLNTASASLEIDIPLSGAIEGSGDNDSRLRFTREFLTAGELSFGPNGTQSRYYFDGSTVSADFLPVALDQVTVNSNFPWFSYVDSLEQVLLPSKPSEYLVQPVAMPVKANPDAQCPAGTGEATTGAQLFACLTEQVLGGTPREAVIANLYSAGAAQGLPYSSLTTMHYAVEDLYQGLAVYVGAEKPKLFFSLKAEPKAIFINFEIPEDRAEAFREAFLPASFELARIRFYPEQCEPVYAVSLNVYEATGQNLDSFRAEWSTYVINPAENNPRPRFSVLEAQSTAGGFDPVVALQLFREWQERNPGETFNFTDPDDLFQLIEEPNPNFSYTADASAGSIQINLTDQDEGISLEVSIGYPDASRILVTSPLNAWMEANDFVYWKEVADILKYDSNVMFAELLVFDAAPSDIIRDSTFEGYVDPEPLPIILWNGPQNIALEPWGTLDGIPVTQEE